MEIRFTGGAEVYTALSRKGFRRITVTGDGYMIYVMSVPEVQLAAEVAFELGFISLI